MQTKLTPEKLDELERLEKAATKAPVIYLRGNRLIFTRLSDGCCGLAADTEDDKALYAALRNNAASLIAAARENVRLNLAVQTAIIVLAVKDVRPKSWIERLRHEMEMAITPTSVAAHDDESDDPRTSEDKRADAEHPTDRAEREAIEGE